MGRRAAGRLQAGVAPWTRRVRLSSSTPLSALRTVRGDTLVDVLRTDLVESLRPLVAFGEQVALVDLPDHHNPGDAAVAAGALRALRSVGAHVAYLSTRDTYSRDAATRAVGDGVVLLSGGGNLGDLYPWNQRFREQVIADFPHNRIVQLPQTMHFTSATRLDEARRAMSHDRLTLLLRDETSLQRARDAFDVASSLCPDAAFGLGPITRARAPRRPILCLGRRDGEATGEIHRLGGADLTHTDWPLTPIDIVRGSVRRLSRLTQDAADADGGGDGEAGETTLVTRAFGPRVGPSFAALASAAVPGACRMLAGAQVVITDRLHGHVLCLLQGIPHVVLDDRFGKVGTFFRTWSSTSATASFATDPFEALELARALAARADA